MQGGLNCALPRQAWPCDNKLNVNKHLEQIENSLQVIFSRISNRLASVVPRLDSAIHFGPVFQNVDNAIHRINVYPLNSAIGFPNTYPLDSDLSGG